MYDGVEIDGRVMYASIMANVVEKKEDKSPQQDEPKQKMSCKRKRKSDSDNEEA